MQVRRVLSRAARSLLAQRTRTVTGDGLRKVWRWSLGAEPNDAAVLEARQYLAADLDVEAIYFNEAHYSAYGPRFSGMWEPGEEAYDPHRLAKQRIVTTPSVGVEVRFALSATWVDRARRGRDLAVRLGNKTKATVEPLARRGYRAARDRVTREQAVKHLRRAPAAVSDQSGTHTVRASLSFTPEQGVRWETLREQLTRAGVLVGECDDVPGAKADGAADAGAMGRNPYYRDKAEDDGRSRMCDVCGRISASRREPPVDPKPVLAMPGRPAPSKARRLCLDCSRVAQQDVLEHSNEPGDEKADFGVLRDRSRVVDREGVLHLTGEPFPASLTKVVPHCGRRLDIGPVKYFDALVKRGDPTPAGARSICMDCVEAERESMGEALQDALNSDSTASCPGCGRAYGAAGVSCHRTPADGWVCDHPLTQGGVSKMTVTHPEEDLQPHWEAMARLMHLLRLVDMTGTMHLARTLITDPAALQRSSTYCGFEHALTPDQVGTIYQSAARFHEPTPAGAVRVCEECVRHRQPFGREWSLELGIAAPGESMQDTASSSETDDGDEMPVLKVAHDAKVYLPRLMVQADMVHSQKDAARLINSGQVTIDGKPCVGKLTYRGYELVGFVVELGGEGTLGNLPRIYEAMTHRFGVSMA